MSEEKNLNGINGWLVLVAIGLILSPIAILSEILMNYTDLFSSELWTALTTPGTESYNPLLSSTIIAELAGKLILFFAVIYTGYKFFTKSKKFPKWFIGILIFNLLFVIAQNIALKLILPGDEVSSTNLNRALLAAFIWIPYMLSSKRVKATFINESR